MLKIDGELLHVMICYPDTTLRISLIISSFCEMSLGGFKYRFVITCNIFMTFMTFKSLKSFNFDGLLYFE